MLSSLGNQESDDRLREFAAFLTKPIKPSQLYNTLNDVLTGEPGKRSQYRPSQPESDEFDPTMGTRLPLRILLAEDNSINQQLALHTLERLGYRADVAANGLEALDAVQQRHYDVILMDIQMPEMDGLEATRRIRKAEGRRQASCTLHPAPCTLHSVYIIAVTANAMHGDRNRCLAAGMDDYISKPFEVRELVAALERAAAGRGYSEGEKVRDSEGERVRGLEGEKSELLTFPNSQFPAPSSQPPVPGIQSPEPNPQNLEPRTQPPALSSILDPAAIKRLKTMLGKQMAAMLPGLLNNFFNDTTKLLERAHQAYEQRQAEEVGRAAHTLKSNALNFGAATLADLCQQLEHQAETGAFEHAEELLAQIEAEYAKVRTALETLREGL
jgi:CheY-like chemotaxis protein/HPt (histidine-containing phosphotransfer) domain-containing protein